MVLDRFSSEHTEPDGSRTFEVPPDAHKVDIEYVIGNPARTKLAFVNTEGTLNEMTTAAFNYFLTNYIKELSGTHAGCELLQAIMRGIKS